MVDERLGPQRALGSVLSGDTKPSYAREGELATWTLATVALAYLIHAALAIVSHRHLFGDASWYLVRIISEGNVAYFYDDFAREFYNSRVFAFWLTQLPTVLALRLGVADHELLSWVLGTTYFSFKLLSLLACYALLPQERKILVIFPVLALFAGTINSDVYIVTETHLIASFFWPMLFALYWLRDPISDWTLASVAAAIVLTSLMFEAMAVLAMVLMLALVWGAGPLDGVGRAKRRLLLALLAISSSLNWVAILFPRDPQNKAAFTAGIYKLVHDSIAGIRSLHIEAAVSVLALLLVVGLLFARRTPTTPVRFAIALAVFVLALAPPIHFLGTRRALDLSIAITDRGFGGGVMQLAIAASFFLVEKFRRATAPFAAVAIMLVVVALAIGQVTWQIMATKAWVEVLAAIRHVLATRTGPVACAEVSADYAASTSVALDRVACAWWIAPLSILMSPNGRVTALIVDTNPSRLKPFDPYDSRSLPRMAFAPVNYDDYAKALPDAMRVSDGRAVRFTTHGRGFALLREGFSAPEAWGTWTDGNLAVMSVCGFDDRSPAASSTLTFKVGAFVPKVRPTLNATIRIRGDRIGEWTFANGDAIGDRTVDIPHRLATPAGCIPLSFEFGNVESPAALGISQDPRRLGLAFIELSSKRTAAVTPSPRSQ